jgi:beta-glucoside operon transcriptional antiterminator
VSLFQALPGGKYSVAGPLGHLWDFYARFFVCRNALQKSGDEAVRLVKALNNNVALAKDVDGREIVVTGKGIAFNIKPGQEIDKKRVSKVFVLQTDDLARKMGDLLTNIRMECAEIVDEIVRYAKDRLNGKMSDYIYLALTDHISFAFDRYEKGYRVKNVILWEIKKFYKEEYAVGLKALEIIKNKTGVAFDEDEAGFIALHFVNSKMETYEMDTTIKMTKMVQDILDIVKYHFKMTFDEDSLNFIRFLTHLKFFAQRTLMHESFESENDDLFLIIRNKYPEEYKCVEKIAKYVAKGYNHEITNDEKVYLMLHMARIVRRNH